MLSQAGIELFIRRLDTTGRLELPERDALRALPIRDGVVQADEDIVREGDIANRMFIVVDGLICANKLAMDGRRQIVAFHLPGDAPDLQSLHLARLDMSLTALTRSRICYVPHSAVREMCLNFPRVAHALWRHTLVDASVFREWITSIGQRSAPSRIVHLFCELYVKAATVGLVADNSMDLPITQTKLGEALGLSTVHVNRSLQDLRARGLFSLGDGRLTVHDWQGMVRLANFSADYLHLQTNPMPE